MLESLAERFHVFEFSSDQATLESWSIGNDAKLGTWLAGREVSMPPNETKEHCGSRLKETRSVAYLEIIFPRKLESPTDWLA